MRYYVRRRNRMHINRKPQSHSRQDRGCHATANPDVVRGGSAAVRSFVEENRRLWRAPVSHQVILLSFICGAPTAIRFKFLTLDCISPEGWINRITTTFQNIVWKGISVVKDLFPRLVSAGTSKVQNLPYAALVHPGGPCGRPRMSANDTIFGIKVILIPACSPAAQFFADFSSIIATSCSVACLGRP